MGRETESLRLQFQKLHTLSDRLTRAIRKDKDLTKEKYQKCYEKCRSLRDKLEKEALGALDSGDASNFDEAAEVIHDAAVALDLVKSTLEGYGNSGKAERPSAAENKNDSDDPSNWASFPPEFEESISGRHTSASKTGDDWSRLHAYGQEETRAYRQQDSRTEETPIRDHGSHAPTAAPVVSEKKMYTTEDVMSNISPPRHIYNNVTRKETLGDDLTEDTPASSENRMDPKNWLINDTKGSKGGHKSDAKSVECSTHDSMIETRHNRRPLFLKQESRKSKPTDTEDFVQSTVDKTRKRANRSIGVVSHPTRDELKSEYRNDDHTDLEHMTYISALEKCLMFSDCYRLGHRLLEKTLEQKIQECNAFIDEHVEWSTDGYDTEVIRGLSSYPYREETVLEPGLDNLNLSKAGGKPLDAEPLWRVKDDGGISTYIGRFLTEGGSLFDAGLFTVDLGLCLLEGSHDVEVQIEVTRKLANIEIITWLTGEGTETVEMLHQSPTGLTFLCNPYVWSYNLPNLVVEALESDGTKRKFVLKLPIGPSALFEPLDISQKKIERVLKNGPDVGFYTMHRSYVTREKIELSKLLAALSRQFHIRKTNVKNTLSTVDHSDNVVVLTIQCDNDILDVNLWSSDEKSMTSACSHIKEVASYVYAIRNKKHADMALQVHSVFPLEFDTNISGISHVPQNHSMTMNGKTVIDKRVMGYKAGINVHKQWLPAT